MLPTRGIKVLPALALLAALGGLGCGQGEGDRCEIDDDCSGELVCVLTQGRAEGTCRSQAGSRPVDAATPDRLPTDLAPDRALDASPDLAPDASPDTTPDAGVAATDASPDAASGS